MSRKYTKEMVAEAVWNNFVGSPLYCEAVDTFNEKGFDGKAVVQEIWNSDVNWELEIGRWNGSMAIRFATLASKYKVDNREMLESLWSEAAEVNYRWDDLYKAQKFVGSCDWHLKRTTDEVAIRTWQLAKEQLTEYVEKMWHEIQIGNQSTSTFYEAQALWESTKATTK